ncbi:MAG: hypothetical protein IKB54_03460 [Clostridia bacterium]|nr:hypothetical protein [Clostridia bacterium]
MRNLNTKAIGDIGEEIAVLHLIHKGYKILERNAEGVLQYLMAGGIRGIIPRAEQL